jgi:hypothetical protein
MKRSEIEGGKTYIAKVSGRLVSVRIERDRGTRQSGVLYGRSFGARDIHDGWDAINTVTGRAIHIKTAAKLRGGVG